MVLKQESPNKLIVGNYKIFQLIISIIFIVVSIIVTTTSFDYKTIISWILIALGLIGILGVVKWNKQLVTFDKTSNIVKIQNKGLFQSNEEKYNIQYIRAVELNIKTRTRISNSGHGGRSGTSKIQIVNIIFTNGAKKEIYTKTSNISTGGFNITPNTDVGKKVADFLGVKYEERRPPTVSETLGAIKDGISQGISNSSENKGNF